jgi:hypothetical protein
MKTIILALTFLITTVFTPVVNISHPSDNLYSGIQKLKPPPKPHSAPKAKAPQPPKAKEPAKPKAPKQPKGPKSPPKPPWAK